MNRPIHGGNLAWAASQAGCLESEIVDFSASINPLGPPESAIVAIKKGIDWLKAYPDPNYSQLRLSLSAWHQIPPEWILPGNGSAELLTWASWELSQLETTYIITPAFSDYWRALQTFKTKITPCPLDLDKGGLDSPQFTIHREEFKETGLLWNNPHNPTGKMWRVEEILPYLETMKLVVIDEAFMDFLVPQEQQSLIPLIEKFPNLVILRSLTKFYTLPGLRLGYAISHPDRLKKWQKWRDPWPVNILASLAAEAVLQDRDFQNKTWQWLEPTRAKLIEDLSAIPALQPLPGSANFLLVKTAIPSSLLQTKLLKQNRILIRDCLSFPELGEDYFRVAIRLRQENQSLIDALCRLGCA